MIIPPGFIQFLNSRYSVPPELMEKVKKPLKNSCTFEEEEIMKKSLKTTVNSSWR